MHDRHPREPRRVLTDHAVVHEPQPVEAFRGQQRTHLIRLDGAAEQ